MKTSDSTLLASQSLQPSKHHILRGWLRLITICREATWISLFWQHERQMKGSESECHWNNTVKRRLRLLMRQSSDLAKSDWIQYNADKKSNGGRWQRKRFGGGKWSTRHWLRNTARIKCPLKKKNLTWATTQFKLLTGPSHWKFFFISYNKTNNHIDKSRTSQHRLICPSWLLEMRRHKLNFGTLNEEGGGVGREAAGEREGPACHCVMAVFGWGEGPRRS